MKRTLFPVVLALLFFALPRPAKAAIASVQFCSNTLSGAVTSISCSTTVGVQTLSGAIGAGHLLIVCVTSNLNDTYTLSGDSSSFVSFLSATSWDSGGRFTSCSYVANTTGGGTAITATQTSGDLHTPALNVDEFSGAATSPLDQHPAGATGTGVTATSNSATPSQNNELIYGFVNYVSISTINPGTGYTMTTNTGEGAGSEYKILATAGATTTSFATGGGSQPWVCVIATFEPPSAGGVVRHRAWVIQR